MIQVTRLDGTEVWINHDLIVTLERTPDTLMTLTTGVHVRVLESVEDVVERVVAFRRRLLAAPLVVEPDAPDPALTVDVAREG